MNCVPFLLFCNAANNAAEHTSVAQIYSRMLKHRGSSKAEFIMQRSQTHPPQIPQREMEGSWDHLLRAYCHSYVKTMNMIGHQHAVLADCHHGDWYVSLWLPDSPTGRDGQQSKIKVETTSKVHARPAEQGGCGSQDGWMDGLTGDDRLSEKSESGEWRGRKVGIKKERWGHFSVSWWASDRCSVRAESDQSQSLIYSEILASASGRCCLISANLISMVKTPCESWPLSIPG